MKRRRFLGSKPSLPDSANFDGGTFEWQFSVRECRLVLPAQVFCDLQGFARQCVPLETGGTLVGTITPDCRVAEIRVALHAHSAAKRRRFTFFRPADKDDKT